MLLVLLNIARCEHDIPPPLRVWGEPPTSLRAATAMPKGDSDARPPKEKPPKVDRSKPEEPAASSSKAAAKPAPMKLPAHLDSSNLVWSATWSINGIELPISLPAPVCTPHELCRKAAKLVTKYAPKSRVTNEKDHVLLHWALADSGLVVQGGDDLQLLIKGSVLSANGVSRRFMTKERRVHIQKTAANFTKVLKKGGLVDVHSAGDYAIELGVCDDDPDERGDPDDFLGGVGEIGIYQVTSMTLRFDHAEIAMAIANVAGSGASAEGGAGGKGGSDSAARMDTVRNLDTGEVYHVSEVEERVSLGVQPTSLRPISRYAPSRGGEGSKGIFAALLQAVVGEKHVNVALEPALLPLPAIALQGDLLTGALLRATINTDCFRVGDCLATKRAEAVQWVVWRRHRSAADRGEVIKRSRVQAKDLMQRSVGSVRRPSSAPPGAASSNPESALSYTCTVEDVGCFLSVSAEEQDVGAKKGAGGRGGAGASAASGGADAGAGIEAGRAVSGGYVQVHPSLRDTVESHVSAGKATFEAVLLSVHQRKRGEPPMHRGGHSSSSEPKKNVPKVTVRLDGSTRTLQLAYKNSMGLTRAVSKPLSVHTAAAALALKGAELQKVLASGDLKISGGAAPSRPSAAGAGGQPTAGGAGDDANGEVMELVMSERRSYLIKCPNTRSRDVLILTLRGYLREWPPTGCSPPPLLLDAITLEVSMKTNATISSSDSPRQSHGSAGRGGSLLQMKGEGIRRPLTRAPTLEEVLMVTTARTMYADGVEYTWFRIARTGGRSLIPYAHGPNYSPTADDFGCGLVVVAVPYQIRKVPRRAAPEVGRQPPARGGAGGLSARETSRRNRQDEMDSDESSDGEASVFGGDRGGGNDDENDDGDHVYGTTTTTVRAPDEVRLPDHIEAKLHRICVRGVAEFAVLVDDADGEGREECTLILTRSQLSLKAGFMNKRGSWEYAETVSVTLEGWGSHKIQLRVPQTQDDEREGGSAPDGATEAMEVLRITCQSVADRELLALSLRYFVAEYCGSGGGSAGGGAAGGGASPLGRGTTSMRLLSVS